MTHTLDTLTLLSVNAASGLSLGLSVAVLVDVMPDWKIRRHPWLVAAILVAVWLPFAVSGDPVIRRVGNTAVSFYLSILFLAYLRVSHIIETARRNGEASERSRD